VVAYHTSELACDVDVTSGASGLSPAPVLEGGGGGAAVAAVMVYVEGSRSPSTFVPFPSAARTVPSLNDNVKLPSFTGLKLMERSCFFPDIGEVFPPSKLTVPAELEKVGSTAQRPNAEPFFETESTVTRVESKFTVAFAEFTAVPPVSTEIFTVNVFPTENEPVEGENESVAACAETKRGATHIASERNANRRNRDTI